MNKNVLMFFVLFSTILYAQNTLKSFTEVSKINHQYKYTRGKKIYISEKNYLIKNKNIVLQLNSNLFPEGHYNALYLFSNELFIVHALVTGNAFENPIKNMFVPNVFNEVIIYDIINNKVFLIGSVDGLGSIYFISKKRLSILYHKSNYRNRLFVLNEDFSPKELIEKKDFFNLLEFTKGKILKKQINIAFENVFDIPLIEINNIISNQSNNYTEEIKCNDEDCFKESDQGIWKCLSGRS
ncbi:hypothetical protein SAMN05444377_10362 [Flavobacterium fontis]|uniref:Uncharacterized protein n=1 Tax=Flavobacterium fontis TaxID=1124188 RepID=A0A1M4YDJ8_9FLAO|nr:hypothetical protein [Flavobacterium fontis]SHF03805.1 hypothetical protein SAMN05444377_10362 [Flavobacterium fontis]